MKAELMGMVTALLLGLAPLARADLGFPALVQDDGLHPRAEAQPRMLENIWPALDTLLHRPR